MKQIARTISHLVEKDKEKVLKQAKGNCDIPEYIPENVFFID